MNRWSLPPALVTFFLRHAHEAAAIVAGRPRASGPWYRLVHLIEDADWRDHETIGLEAARRCRAYEAVGGAHGGALGAWYRALALVLLAGARWRRS